MIDIVLASTSPRRQELLRQIGLTFEIVATDIDERPMGDETPAVLVARLSRDKAVAGARIRAARWAAATTAAGTHGGDTTPARGGLLVIAADTVVVVDGAVLGKPRDAPENRRYLERLAGRAHHVLTGHTLLFSLPGSAAKPAATEPAATLIDTTLIDTTVIDTTVRFRSLDAAEIDRYVATAEGLDKAGGYAVQGRGAALVRSIDGCYSNVVGLSLPTLVESALRLGVRLV